jgi:DNA-binding NtrC family response regulator
LPKILIIDDDFAVRASLSLLLKQNDFDTIAANGPEEAMSTLRDNKFDLIVLDMNFTMETSGEEGLKLLKEIKSLLPTIPVILITAWGSIELAVQGMKLGALDFITKPWNNEHFLQSVRTTLHLSAQMGKGETHSRKQLDEIYNFDDLIGRDPTFLKALETIGRVSSSEASVLILGESGTGKELFAEAIHRNSSRKNQPFVKVNLGGISSSLFESEMFGHVKGAFTDAKSSRIGRFEMANTGSIFLDEIGELDLSSQVKLLRVLQDRNFEVLGSSKTKAVDIRVISATNRNLNDMVADGEFREDLFYRINLIAITIPPLRDRPGDIPLLVNHFVEKLRKTYKRPSLRISNPAIEWMKRLSWPGNIRELKNLVERVILVSNKDVIELEDFTAEYQSGPQKTSKTSIPEVGSMTLDEVEKNMVIKALKHYDNNISKAAKSLGLSRAALYRRMEKFGISI